MKYLDCIELLAMSLRLLKDGSREQVMMGKLPDLQVLTLRCREILLREGASTYKCDDVILAIDVAVSTPSLHNLPSSMRDVLLAGVHACLHDVSELAWDYYSTIDVPIDEATIPLLQMIVENHYN